MLASLNAICSVRYLVSNQYLSVGLGIFTNYMHYYSSSFTTKRSKKNKINIRRCGRIKESALKTCSQELRDATSRSLKYSD